MAVVHHFQGERITVPYATRVQQMAARNAAIWEARRQGVDVEDIADRFELSRSQVYRLLAKASDALDQRAGHD